MSAKSLSPLTNTRRHFLAGLAGAGAVSILPRASQASIGTGRLRMINQHTGETFDRVILENGKWIDESVREFAWFARDWHRDVKTSMDTNVMAIALEVQQKLDSSRPLVLLSGYRSPQTNRSIRGAAKHSLHMDGEALDIYQPGRSTSQLHRAAVALRAGGVGKYTRRNFVHIDCGQVRYWGS